jgi:hypothetical protein
MTTVGGFVPLNDVTTTNTPLLDWANVGNPQTAFEVKIYRDTQFNQAGFDPATSPPTFYSGVIPSGDSQYTIPVGLVNGATYRAYVRVAEGTVGNYIWSTWGGGNSMIQFRILLFISNFSNPTPTNNATLTTSRPILGGTVNGAMPSNVRMRREWQFARDSNFTQEVLTVTENVLSVIPQGAYGFDSLPKRLRAGTWFMRARMVDEYGNSGNWSGTNQLTIAHPPSASSLTPTSGNSVPFGGGTVQIGWMFTDPDGDDYQTSYEIELWPTSNLGALVTRAAVTPVQPADSYTASINLPGAADAQHSWRIRVADQDNTLSPWSATQTFVPRAPGTVAITSPSNNGTVSTPTPTIGWNFTASGGRTQAQYRVDVRANGQTVATSGWVVGTATSWTQATPFVLPATTYQVSVSVIDSAGLEASATATFSATFTQPPAPSFTVDDFYFAETAGMLVDWTGSTISSGFVEWRIYRRLLGATTWRLIAIASQSVERFMDYTCPANTNVEYAVVQARTDPTFGAVVESARNPVSVSAETSHYFLVVPEDSTLNFKIDHVTSDNYEDEYEQETINLIGRGRRHETGTRFGVIGDLSAQLYEDNTYSGRGKKTKLDNIRAARRRAYLRTPFGDVWAVAVSSLKYDRIAGVGTNEYLTVSLQYTEIEDGIVAVVTNTNVSTDRSVTLPSFVGTDTFPPMTVAGGGSSGVVTNWDGGSPSTPIDTIDGGSPSNPTGNADGGGPGGATPSITLSSFTDSDGFPVMTVAAGVVGGEQTVTLPSFSDADAFPAMAVAAGSTNNYDGGTPSQTGPDIDGGTPSTPAGNLDGGPP